MAKLQGGIPIGSKGNVSVALQDQYTRMVVSPLHIDLNTGNLLAVAGNIGDYDITLTAGHGTIVGNCIILKEGNRWFYAIALNVATNVITLDTPLDYAFTTACDVSIGNPNLNVDGSSTPVVCHVEPPDHIRWDITRLHVIIIDDAAMDFTTFGGIAALTNGIVFGKAGGDNPQNIANAKSNGDLIVFSDSYNFEDKVGGGAYAFSARYKFAGQDGVGVTMRIDNSLGEEMRITIQDDLTAISKVAIVAIGHVVED